MVQLRLILAIALILFGGFALPPTEAQSDVCNSLVDEAFEFIGTNCDNLDRNSVCYGYNALEATFFEETDAVTFANPSDRAAVEALRTITTTALNLDDGEWGIAVLNLQTSIPGTLPGQNVTFLMLGDVQVEDATSEIPIEATTPVFTQTTNPTILRRDPQPQSQGISQVAARTDIQVTSVSEDGRWARVTVDDRVGWILATAVADADLSSLGVYDPASFRPMQSIYFTTGVGQPTCNETPDLLLLQSPKNVTVDMRVNGADIRLGSTVLLQLIPPNTMRISTMDGRVVVNPGTPDEIVIPPGFFTTATLSDPQDIGTDTLIENFIIDGEWEEPDPLTEEDLELFAVIERLPESILNYRIELPPLIIVEPDETVTPQAVVVGGGFGGGTGGTGAGTGATATEEVTPEPSTATPIPPPPPDDGGDDDGGDDGGGGDPPPPPPPAPSRSFFILSGNGQTANVGGTFAATMVAELVDASSNPIPGEAVTFTVTGGLASFGGNPSATVTTDPMGTAVSPLLTATGCPVGPVTVQVSAADATPATFSHTVLNEITVTSAADAGAGSLRQAVADICTGGIVTIDGGVPTVSLTSGQIIVSGKAVTVTGGSSGQVIDGTNSTRLFNVVTPGALSLTNLTLQNGNGSGGSGGAIFSDGTLTIASNVVLTNNTSNNGGAITSLGGTVNFDGTANSNSADNGGGITVSGGTLNLQANAQITNNSVTFNGGGILAIGAGANVTFAPGVTVSGNTAGGGGGGLAVRSGATATVRGTFDNNNSSATRGGALFADLGGAITVDGATFTNNTAAIDGGVGHVDASTLNFTNGSNIGAGNGMPDCTSNSGSITDDSSNTGGDGTCYPIPGSPTALNITAGDGQTFDVGGTLPTAMQVQVLDGSSNPVSGESVTFTVTGGLADFGGSSFANVNTDGSGIATAPALQSIGCPAGAVTIEASSGALTPVNFSQTVQNAIAVTNGNDTGAGSLRQAVTDICDGGTVTIDAGVPTVSLTSAQIAVTNKTITVAGGGSGQVVDGSGSTGHFSVSNAASALTVTNLTLQNANNTSIINFGGNLTISANTTLTANAGATFGGAINNQGGTVNVSGTVSNNSAQFGAGVFSLGGTVTFNGTADTNTSTNYGGAFYVSNGGVINLNAGSQVTNNTATNFAGAFYIEGTGGTMNINGATFTGNTAPTGAIGYISGTTSIANFTNTTFGAGNGTPNCANFGGTLNDLGGNTGGDGTCFP